jgi:FKBP-type peptidyl-prolyl cis-trans isomerase
MPIATLFAAAVLLQVPQVAVSDDHLGDGAEAKYGDIVTVNYVGRVLNGQIFDSTRMGPPFSFVLGQRQLIQGHARVPIAALDRSIAGMKVGGRRTITIPSELAFGELQIGDIPGGSKLTFEVELFDVRSKGSEAKLKIEELKEGVGEPSKEGDTMVVHYRGTFLNGRQFDASYGRLQDDGSTKDVPMTVVLGTSRLISGFTQGLTGMKAGGKRRVTIPYDMAYGTNGRPPAIPAFSVLVFELDALSVKRP